MLKQLGSKMCKFIGYLICTQEPAIAAMHGPHSFFNIYHYTVIYCDAGGVSLVDQ